MVGYFSWLYFGDVGDVDKVNDYDAEEQEV